MQLLDHFFLDRHLLEDGQAETLSDAAIGTVDISCNDLEDFLQDRKVIWSLLRRGVRSSSATTEIDEQVVNTLSCASDDRDQSTNCMFEAT